MQWPPAELPGGGQPVGNFSPSELAHGGVAGEDWEEGGYREQVKEDQQEGEQGGEEPLGVQEGWW